MRIPFMKMSGSGNDFILIDHRKALIPEDRMPELARKVCRRKFSIGADGLIFIESSREVDFKWRFFNSDGSEAAMCGNGGRCAARFAHVKGIAGPRLRFETLAGILSASVELRRVKLEMTTPYGLQLDERVSVEGKECVVSIIDTGVPHAVCFVRDVSDVDVVGLGRAIRNHPRFAPFGTNANFVQVEDSSRLIVRTYERGVEDETLACGTGAVASALIAGFRNLVKPPVTVQTSGGDILSVDFQIEAGRVTRVFFEGEVRIIYEGEMWEEAYE
jgi:diaminopimelate epimerase